MPTPEKAAAAQPELPRYHSLDAMRASAMLLGIVFHAAWMYTPAQYWAPVVDSGANYWMWFLDFWTHQFRMQAFIFIAGFFAAMVLQRRGWRAFLAQRARRIGLPLAVGWLICYPVFVHSYNWANARSGAALDDISPWTKTLRHFTTWSDFSENYGLTHLWFLYVLLLLYVATLVAGFLVQRLLGGKPGRIESWADALARFVRSPWGVAGLTVVAAVVNLPANWDVCPTPLKLVPPVSSFLTYWLFFLVGWLFYSRSTLLEIADRRWKWLLGTGCAISLGMFGITVQLYERGRMTDAAMYPFIDQGEIRDWDGLRKDLVAGKDGGDSTAAGRVWTHLKPPAQRMLLEGATPSVNQRIGLAMQMSLEVLTATNLADGLEWKTPPTPEVAALLVKPVAERTIPEAMLLNRRLLEVSFPDRLATSTLGNPAYRWGCVAYTVFYCLVSWLLTFGFLGFFRRFFSHPHATWRYFADAAYWMYILHLPLLFVIEIPLAGWAMVWPVKFVLLNALTFAVLLASYHFLVRSTIVGETLNGRRYPFVSPFGKRHATTP